MLVSYLGMNRNEENKLLTSLLNNHDFEIWTVTEVLFNMVGLVSHDLNLDLKHDEKHEIFKTARAPVSVLQKSCNDLRNYLKTHFETDSEEWIEKHKQLESLDTQLKEARKNAANDIYERMNAAGLMGVVDSVKKDTFVDLHGLFLEEAKQILEQFILPVLSVLRSIIVITERGVHSGDGISVLKASVQEYLNEHKIVWKEVKGNSGSIQIFS